jgi:hypothetical protein
MFTKVNLIKRRARAARSMTFSPRGAHPKWGKPFGTSEKLINYLSEYPLFSSKHQDFLA